MSTLTFNNVPDDLKERLERAASRRGKSRDEVGIEYLVRGLELEGVDADKDGKPSWVDKYAGTWTDEEAREFEESIAFLEEIDEEAWR